jgi:sarcosine oxidase/L-pipecolate oxidase
VNERIRGGRLTHGATQIIRAGDYADPSLAKLAVDAVELWRRPEWEGTYHE